jgi:hypothetical protein
MLSTSPNQVLTAVGVSFCCNSSTALLQISAAEFIDVPSLPYPVKPPEQNRIRIGADREKSSFFKPLSPQLSHLKFQCGLYHKSPLSTRLKGAYINKK